MAAIRTMCHNKKMATLHHWSPPQMVQMLALVAWVVLLLTWKTTSLERENPWKREWLGTHPNTHKTVATLRHFTTFTQEFGYFQNLWLFREIKRRQPTLDVSDASHSPADRKTNLQTSFPDCRLPMATMKGSPNDAKCTLQILSFARYSFSWRCLKTQQNSWNLDDQDNV